MPEPRPGLDAFVSAAPDPAAAAYRVESMLADSAARAGLLALPDERLGEAVFLISVSGFLYRFLLHHPDAIACIGQVAAPPAGLPADAEALRRFKYTEFVKISWMDVSDRFPCERILRALSDLADAVAQCSFSIAAREAGRTDLTESLCALALGKLGARELNYSSDIDLVFTSTSRREPDLDLAEFQHAVYRGIRTMVQVLEQSTDTGFLYRVDLNLRPWGRSGPLCMAIDDTESYYEGSSEAWEQFAWLRARPVAGAMRLGADLVERLRPFIYRRSLGTDDLDRFLKIKEDMSRARNRAGHWNVKVGSGGIRDLEFFVQILQIVNAANRPVLQSTSTLDVMQGLAREGLIGADEAEEIRASYLFLRRLENRLQMVDEQQTHELPDENTRRLTIARSLGMQGQSEDEVLSRFESELQSHRAVARRYFDRILLRRGA